MCAKKENQYSCCRDKILISIVVVVVRFKEYLSHPPPTHPFTMRMVQSVFDEERLFQGGKETDCMSVTVCMC